MFILLLQANIDWLDWRESRRGDGDKPEGHKGAPMGASWGKCYHGSKGWTWLTLGSAGLGRDKQHN